MAASKSGSDLTRVIPTCAVTGEASGVAAAYIAKNGYEADIKTLQNDLTNLINSSNNMGSLSLTPQIQQAQ